MKLPIKPAMNRRCAIDLCVCYHPKHEGQCLVLAPMDAEMVIKRCYCQRFIPHPQPPGEGKDRYK